MPVRCRKSPTPSFWNASGTRPANVSRGRSVPGPREGRGLARRNLRRCRRPGEKARWTSGPEPQTDPWPPGRVSLRVRMGVWLPARWKGEVRNISGPCLGVPGLGAEARRPEGFRDETAPVPVKWHGRPGGQAGTATMSRGIRKASSLPLGGPRGQPGGTIKGGEQARQLGSVFLGLTGSRSGAWGGKRKLSSQSSQGRSLE